MLRLSPLAFAGALLATSITVLAATPAMSRTRHVSYADLDLTTDAGRAAMDARLRKAASSVCLSEYSRDLMLANACRRDTLAQARADLDRVVQGNQVQMAGR